MRQRRSAAHSRPDAKRTRKARHDGSLFAQPILVAAEPLGLDRRDRGD